MPGRHKSSDAAPKWNELMLTFRSVQSKHEKSRRLGTYTMYRLCFASLIALQLIGTRLLSQEKSSRRGGISTRGLDDTFVAVGAEEGPGQSTASLTSSTNRRDRSKPPRSDSSSRMTTTTSLPTSLSSRSSGYKPRP